MRAELQDALTALQKVAAADIAAAKVARDGGCDELADLYDQQCTLMCEGIVAILEAA